MVVALTTRARAQSPQLRHTCECQVEGVSTPYLCTTPDLPPSLKPLLVGQR